MSDERAEPLFARLRAAAGAEWHRYVDHPFVSRLAAGTLAEASFRHYLAQDYLFLIHFARAYGLAAFKADTLDDIRSAAAGLDAMVGQEMRLHFAYCRRWGLGEEQLAATPEADATMAYTRYVLEKGLAGDLLDLYVALAPCIIGYAEIGVRLARDPATRMTGNPYREWIEMYAGEAYQQTAAAHGAQLDALMARRGGPGRMPSLKTTFRQATRLEAGFWEMALGLPE